MNAKGKVIRDPIHGLIRIDSEDAVILELMDTPEFQRLRRIRQLGVSWMTYPGAEHSRFTHSLGVFNFAQRIVNNLLHRYRDYSDAISLLKEHRKDVLAAALLHDIGHAPFSHMMEREKGAHHEEKTIELITGKSSSIPAALEKAKVNPSAVADIISKSVPCRLLVDIVSSQLDADRMDYILRDALATGVKYGAYDSEWLLNSLCIGSEPNHPESNDPTKWRLCLDEKRGLHSAEQLIIARMHMSLQVYFHRATRSWEAHLLCLFKVAARLAQENKLPAGTPEVVGRFFSQKGKLSHQEFLSFDEPALFYAFTVWANGSDDQLREFAGCFLIREKLFLSHELGVLGVSESAKLFSQLGVVGEEGIDWYLDEANFNSYKDFGTVFRTKISRSEDEISTSAILLSDGSLGAPSKPVEIQSRLCKAWARIRFVR